MTSRRPEPADRVFYGRADVGNGLEFLSASYDRHRFAKHFHDTFSIGLVETGLNDFVLGRRDERAGPGSLCIVNPGEVHTGGGAVRWSYRNVYPKAELLGEAALQATGRPGLPEFPRGVVDEPRAVLLFRRFFASLEAAGPLLLRETRLLELLAHLVVHHAERGPMRRETSDTPAVARARAYLTAHAADDVSLRTLAGVAGRSPYHLLRLFRRATGLPPHAYLVQLRLQRAKALLMTGAAPTAAAAEAGFSDQAHLTRRFKATYGVTPGRMTAARGGTSDRNFVQDGSGGAEASS